MQSLKIHFTYSYFYHVVIPQYTCLCEVCENAVLLSKGLDQACSKKGDTNETGLIVKEYTCSSDNKSCMSSDCEDCKYHGLLIYEDFVKDDDKQNEIQSAYFGNKSFSLFNERLHL